jgi:DNA-binding Xre family transcriptional regulator
MNRSHSAVTDWGLHHISIRPHDTILDIGCGGGRTIAKLAEKCTAGKVYGVDYSETSVTASRKTNSAAIAHGGVEVRHGFVSQLPFPEGTFDLITAVVNIDVMLARRKMSVTELADKVGITIANLSILKNGKGQSVQVLHSGGLCKALNELPAGGHPRIQEARRQQKLLIPVTSHEVERHRSLPSTGGTRDLILGPRPDRDPDRVYATASIAHVSLPPLKTVARVWQHSCGSRAIDV